MKTDYHDFTHRGTTKVKRDILNVGDIYVNAAECKKCGYFIRSKNRQDMVYCKCGAIAVDGGSHYLKRTGNDEDMIIIMELYNDVVDENIKTEEEHIVGVLNGIITGKIDGGKSTYIQPTLLKCQDCGVVNKTVKECNCPFSEEITGELLEIVVCDSCYKDLEQDI